ncbi:NAD(P)/FAD-dependent oxidoreductase [Tomitella cavernea]|uniref:FAD-dependent oxidoreductase n=1 Tax=Tomitella cavernea TaxID=1387982 RepID=A0ABP9C4F9_9ACTN|nr:NAD(P)/FAD-dependent oxidoreductase [Tomitella cavernea]
MRTCSHTVIIGGGLAATTLVEEVRKHGVDDAISIVSDEIHLPYDRPPLSKRALREDPADIGEYALRPAEWAEQMRVDFMLGSPAMGWDPSSRLVHLSGGRQVHFDRLIVATGAQARVLEAAPPGGQVHYLRNWSDVQALHQCLADNPGGRLLIVGAGFIGLEVASSMLERDIEVVEIVEAGPRPLSRVLPDALAELCWRPYQDARIPLSTGTALSGIETTPRGVTATLSDGRRIDCELVVVAAGSVPNTAWAAGLEYGPDGAIVCDGSGRSSVDGVWALGDAAAWPNPYVDTIRRIEHWQAAIDQAAVVAADLAGAGAESWGSAPYFWSDLLGGRVQLVGEAPATATTHTATRGERTVTVIRRGDTVAGVFARRRPRAMIAGRALLGSDMSALEAQAWCDRTVGVPHQPGKKREFDVQAS